MAYCPQCGVEYRDGFLECADCHVALRAGTPPAALGESRKQTGPPLVQIRIFSGSMAMMQADMARNLLETEGIPCVLPGKVMGGILSGIEPIAMLVREVDAARAAEILQAFLDDPQPATGD